MIAQANLRRLLQALPLLLLASASAASPAFFPQPNPSNQEQYLLELINAARANPAAEGVMLATVSDPQILLYYSHYAVNTNQLVSDFAGYAAKPPLAFNADLMASSRQQSLYQAAAGVQTHNSADGTAFNDRIGATGYQWGALGENVFAYVEDPFFGHVGLMADWGVPSLDHRVNLMNLDPNFPLFKEIGISCVPSSLPNFGPLVVTEDFGTPADSSVSYLVGVVYQDANHNGAYDENEGLGGVTITTDSGAYFTTTTSSGGYQIPLPAGSGSLTITASGAGLGAPRVKTIQYGNATNVKVDFTTTDPSGPTLPLVTLKAVTPTANAAGGQTAVLKVARHGDTSAPLAVSLSVAGSAVSGVDYSPLPPTVTIPAGAKSATLQVTPLNNPASGNKKMKVRLAAGAGYTITSDVTLAKANVTITTN